MFKTPEAEIVIEETLVRRLLAEQAPQWAEHSLAFVDEGFDNVTYRLGEEMAVRLPRRDVAAELLVNEARWLPKLAPRLPVAIPVPRFLGSPTDFYPWPWAVVPWFDGTTAQQVPLAESEAVRLGDFFKALHQPAPDDAPENPYRGCPLSFRQDAVEARFEVLRTETSALTETCLAIWELALSEPIDAGPVWLHGDPHGRNMISDQGRLAAVIDWGDITSGDPAGDLAAFWSLFEHHEARRAGLAAYGPLSEATYHRTRGWAFSYGALLLATGLADHPAHEQMGRDILRRLDQEGL